jgi:hypothetical protein
VCVQKEPLVPRCVGCPSVASVDDDALAEAARWGVLEVSKARNGARSLELVRIVRASKQVVAGAPRPRERAATLSTAARIDCKRARAARHTPARPHPALACVWCARLVAGACSRSETRAQGARV